MKYQKDERFLRCLGIMTEEDLKKIQSTSVAIGGLGLGGSIFINLVRMGFHNFHIADPDVYERTNINRQRLARESTVGSRKDEALLREALDINPKIRVKMYQDGISEKNVKEFLEGMDWVIDVVDVFALNEKLALNEEARKRGLPVASCGALGFGAAVIVFDKTTPSFAELTGMKTALPYETNIKHFIQFLCPEVPDYMQEQLSRAMRKESHIPFVVPGVEISAAVAVTEVAKQILNLGKKIRAPQGIYVDPVKAQYEIFKAHYKARSIDKPLRKAS